MKKYLLILVTACFALQSYAGPVSKKRRPAEEDSKKEYNYFDEAAKQISEILAQEIFKKYSGYTIDNVRQGEIGEAQAYFIRLVKPFAADNEGVCVAFYNAQKMADKPHACKAAE